MMLRLCILGICCGGMLVPSMAQPSIPSSGCVLHLRASLGITVNPASGRVVSWQNQCGATGLSFEQSNTDFQPYYVTSSSRFNSHNSLWFHREGNDALGPVNLPIAENQDRSVIVVFNTEASYNGAYFEHNQLLGTDAQHMMDVGTSTGFKRLLIRNNTTDYSTADNTVSFLDTIATASSSNGIVNIWSDGASVATNVATDAFSWGMDGGLTIGVNSVAGTSFKGNVAEVIIHDRVLSNAEYTTLVAELGTYYGIATEPFASLVPLTAPPSASSITGAPTVAPTTASPSTALPMQSPTLVPSPALPFPESAVPAPSPILSPTLVPPSSSSPVTPVLPTSGGGGGDPHFKTWSGMRYDWHGVCDLVFLYNPTFLNGKGLRIHIRTTRKGHYSFIERVAVMIGTDTLEFAGRNEWYKNQQKVSSSIAKQRWGPYKLRVHERAVSVRLNEPTKAKIDLIQRKNGFLYLVVDGGSSDMFRGSLGMIGDWESGHLIARDGETRMDDVESFAHEWQVRHAEPRLFQDLRAPQHPTQCSPAKKQMLGNRLGATRMQEKAEKACRTRVDDKQECIFDVMVTRDIKAAAF